ncbi:membrane-bound PQQ-dependent dehydrogenase, glucose/quinate/shikimate family [Shinella fusca]|uniref:Quinoprotein glucose dehydrogenase n=1 Tax=Shinella fusca TaxID=544480 RepID=A0A7W7YU74_9HYPH|nr:membrane-bound PQQ-dependent dehydrogenase, glucose/quinate/shikimate family [Shinella fusca]MBB5042331.1 quinoprotein glucose dehydrogenase [Shinella fusca]
MTRQSIAGGRARPWWTIVTGVAAGLLGLGLLGLGAWLLLLGGSPYYAAAGLLLLAAGILIVLGRPAGIWLYAALLVGTVLWSLYEVGLDGWALIPRLVAPAVLGIWLFSPLVAGRLQVFRQSTVWPCYAAMAACAILIGLVFLAGYRITERRTIEAAAAPANTVAGIAAGDDDGVAPENWNFYGRTPAGDRYSPLDRITPENVSHLTQAWSFSTGDLPKEGENGNGREFSFEATPIKVGDSLYFCTPHRDVVALDATTGQQKWRYSPGGDMSKNVYQACRGVSYFEAPQTSCPHRIISTASDLPRLFALDAETGKPCETFGSNGQVDLREHMGPVPPGFHFISSPPMIVNGKIILGGWVYDNQTVGEPSGVVRAFDAVSGAPAWSWDIGKTPANRKPAPDETYTRGTPNGWGVYTADPGLNLVYVPLGSPTPDYFGGKRRPFDDAYSSSLVALDIATGAERWHFQTVHHDLWDFDLPAGPALVDLPDRNGSVVPALIQTTKQGEIFVLDRRSGQPVFPVEEKPVPSGDIPGERYSPTQPFSTGMPSLRAPKLTEKDMWGATPVDQLLCRIEFRRMHDEGLFTPPGLRPTIGWPAFDGTSDWYGATVDPARRTMYINTTFMPFKLRMLPYGKALEKGLFQAWSGWNEPYPQPPFKNNPQHGTPFSIVVEPWLSPLEIPCVQPPWGQMQAIDLASRKVLWQRPFGTTRDMGPFGLRLPVGLPTGVFSMGGSIATKSGLLFIGATTDQYIRALDAKSGKTLWSDHLPAGGNATPLTYLGRDGRQYVVIAAGGHGGLRSRNGDRIVAYALPGP